MAEILKNMGSPKVPAVMLRINDEELKIARLALVKKVKAVLGKGLDLLNISYLDEM